MVLTVWWTIAGGRRRRLVFLCAFNAGISPPESFSGDGAGVDAGLMAGGVVESFGPMFRAVVLAGFGVGIGGLRAGFLQGLLDVGKDETENPLNVGF